LTAIAGVVDTTTLEEWLSKAKSLSESDFRTEIVEIRENKGKAIFIPAPRLQRCLVCGGWVVVADEKTLCHC
jgi:hypothetical protein